MLKASGGARQLEHVQPQPASAHHHFHVTNTISPSTSTTHAHMHLSSICDPCDCLPHSIDHTQLRLGPRRAPGAAPASTRARILSQDVSRPNSYRRSYPRPSHLYTYARLAIPPPLRHTSTATYTATSTRLATPRRPTGHPKAAKGLKPVSAHTQDTQLCGDR